MQFQYPEHIAQIGVCLINIIYQKENYLMDVHGKIIVDY